MLNTFTLFFKIISRTAQGNRFYFLWLGFLFLLITIGFYAYLQQLEQGLIVTALRDQVSWGFYIANFTFLVGVAAAAVLLVVPAYIYDFRPIKEIVLLGELLAVCAIIMCMLFIFVDMGRLDRFTHLLPFLGGMNLPSSLLSWDIVVLVGYLVVNLFISIHVLYKMAHQREYNLKLIKPLIIILIPWAVAIHTVTAFLYNGLSARPYWNASILAPRFLASAFCSGPAVMLITFQIIRKVSKLEIENKAIFKIAELVAYAMGINLFILASEFFKEFYSGSTSLSPLQYLYFGIGEHNNMVSWMWSAMYLNITAFILFLHPRTRENLFTLNVACVLIIIGIYIEKGLGLVIPGFVPSTLGEIYEYSPNMSEKGVVIGIWAFGALLYTLLLKCAIPIYMGEFNKPPPPD